VIHPLAPPPWAALAAADRHVDLDRVRVALASAPPPGLISIPDTEIVGEAAVLMPIFEEAGEAWLVLIRRAAHMQNNAGDVAFPGGRREPGELLPDTARREAEEEIGLDPSSVSIVAELDHNVTGAGFEMVPFVGLLPGRPVELRADPGEVETVLTVPIAELLVLGHYRGEDWGDRQMHEFDLEGDTIWGATARVLHRFLELVLAVEPA